MPRFDERHGCRIMALLLLVFLAGVAWAFSRPAIGVPVAAAALAAGILLLQYSTRRDRQAREANLEELQHIAPAAGSSWRAIASAGGMAAHLARLEPLVRPAVRLARTDRAPTLGESRLGGWPDLPADLPWPRHQGRPLMFLAQVDLAAVHRALPGNALPADGHLWFFYSQEQPWGFDPNDAGSSRVLYRPAGAPLAPAPPGTADDASDRYPPAAVEMVAYEDLPEMDEAHPLVSELSEEQRERYAAMREYLTRGGDGTGHKLLGHADPVQGPMELECELVANGLYCGDTSGYQDPRARELEGRSRDWRLLLQVDSDDSAQMMWGDIGQLYFWIRQDDLRQARFDRAWVILQCH